MIDFQYLIIMLSRLAKGIPRIGVASISELMRSTESSQAKLCKCIQSFVCAHPSMKTPSHIMKGIVECKIKDEEILLGSLSFLLKSSKMSDIFTLEDKQVVSGYLNALADQLDGMTPVGKGEVCSFISRSKPSTELKSKVITSLKEYDLKKIFEHSDSEGLGKLLCQSMFYTKMPNLMDHIVTLAHKDSKALFYLLEANSKVRNMGLVLSSQLLNPLIENANKLSPTDISYLIQYLLKSPGGQKELPKIWPNVDISSLSFSHIINLLEGGILSSKIPQEITNAINEALKSYMSVRTSSAYFTKILKSRADGSVKTQAIEMIINNIISNNDIQYLNKFQIVDEILKYREAIDPALEACITSNILKLTNNTQLTSILKIACKPAKKSINTLKAEILEKIDIEEIGKTNPLLIIFLAQGTPNVQAIASKMIPFVEKNIPYLAANLHKESAILSQVYLPELKPIMKQVFAQYKPSPIMALMEKTNMLCTMLSYAKEALESNNAQLIEKVCCFPLFNVGMGYVKSKDSIDLLKKFNLNGIENGNLFALYNLAKMNNGRFILANELAEHIKAQNLKFSQKDLMYLINIFKNDKENEPLKNKYSEQLINSHTALSFNSYSVKHLDFILSIRSDNNIKLVNIEKAKLLIPSIISHVPNELEKLIDLSCLLSKLFSSRAFTIEDKLQLGKNMKEVMAINTSPLVIFVIKNILLNLRMSDILLMTPQLMDELCDLKKYDYQPFLSVLKRLKTSISKDIIEKLNSNLLASIDTNDKAKNIIHFLRGSHTFEKLIIKSFQMIKNDILKSNIFLYDDDLAKFNIFFPEYYEKKIEKFMVTPNPNEAMRILDFMTTFNYKSATSAQFINYIITDKKIDGQTFAEILRKNHRNLPKLSFLEPLQKYIITNLSKDIIERMARPDVFAIAHYILKLPLTPEQIKAGKEQLNKSKFMLYDNANAFKFLLLKYKIELLPTVINDIEVPYYLKNSNTAYLPIFKEFNDDNKSTISCANKLQVAVFNSLNIKHKIVSFSKISSTDSKVVMKELMSLGLNPVEPMIIRKTGRFSDSNGQFGDQNGRMGMMGSRRPSFNPTGQPPATPGSPLSSPSSPRAPGISPRPPFTPLKPQDGKKPFLENEFENEDFYLNSEDEE